MKMVIQRVSRAEVRVDGRVVGAVDTGLVVLVGLEKGDGGEQLERAAGRLVSLRVFEDAHGKMNRGLDEVDGGLLLISQFTLAGSIRRGRRPGFDGAMPGSEAEPMFEEFVQLVRSRHPKVATGIFGAHMDVDLVNDGPVTLLWEDAPTL